MLDSRSRGKAGHADEKVDLCEHGDVRMEGPGPVIMTMHTVRPALPKVGLPGSGTLATHF